MLKSQVKSLSIAANQAQPTLSKAQKAFNNLIKKIETKRAQLDAWQTIIPQYQLKHASEITPLINATHEIKTEIVYGLDQACDGTGLTKAERSKLAEIIAALALDLAMESDDDDLKNIYNKYSGSDFDAEQAIATDGIKSMFETMMGVDLGDDVDMSSPEAFIRQAQARLQEQQEKQGIDQQEAPRPSRKKTAKQLAKEAQQLAEEQEIGQSIREVYRKLVSSLHPDREPDQQERDRKTALMQQVNEAYDKKNLLLLLELQLKLEHIDQTTINNLSESRLTHFNKVLKEQLTELEHEIYHTQASFRAQFDIERFVQITPGTLMRHLTAEIVEMQQDIRNMENDLQAVKNIKTLKTWLKGIRLERDRNYPDDGCPF